MAKKNPEDAVFNRGSKPQQDDFARFLHRAANSAPRELTTVAQRSTVLTTTEVSGSEPLKFCLGDKLKAAIL